MAIIQNHAGFNLTGSKLQIVEIAFRDGFYILENVDEEYFKEFWDPQLKDTQLINILQNAYDELLLRNQLNSEFVSFALPHGLFRFAELPYDESLHSEDLDEHLRWEMATMYPKFHKDDFTVRTISKPQKQNGFPKIIVVAALKQYLRILHKFCTKNNLFLKYIDNVHTAAHSLLQFHFGKEYKILTFYLSENNFSIIISEGNEPFYFKVFNINSSLDLDPKLKDVLEKINSDIIKLKDINRFIMTGEPIPRHILPRIEVNFDITFRKFKPFENLNASSPVIETEGYLTKSNTYSAAAGIAFRML